MYGGRLPIPAVKVEDMSTTNREDGKTTIVVLASEPSYSAFGNMVRKWLVCAICALAAVAMNAMWITANAYGDNSSDSSDSSSSSTDSGVTITENITDTENLLGSHAAEVTDAIAKTEKETGVHVHLLYLSSFNSQQKPGDWAATVMESMNPKPNTVMLAVPRMTATWWSSCPRTPISGFSITKPSISYPKPHSSRYWKTRRAGLARQRQ